MADQNRLNDLQKKVDDGSITPTEQQEYDRLKTADQGSPSDRPVENK